MLNSKQGGYRPYLKNSEKKRDEDHDKSLCIYYYILDLIDVSAFPKCEIEATKVDIGSKLESMTSVVSTVALSHLKIVKVGQVSKTSGEYLLFI